ncbi:hypothetical protein [Ruegeria conchae]|uniref:hypothetical protein n=1 Tax=Ruegeria conchae TaxID=981384 RepID=UPI0029C8CBF3|nr:hypothetical protein [Ruegeria conchae]
MWQIEGLDVKGAEIDNLVIVGRNLPPPWQVENLTRQHHFDEKEVQAINGEDGRMPWYGEDYKEIIAGTAGVRPVHPDPRADAVAQSIWKHTLEQAFGRGRGTRRKKRLRVFITHNMPLDVTVHEAVSEAELDARVGDVTLLSPKEIERVFGISGRKFERLQIKPTHKYRMPGQAKGKGYACRVADGANVSEVMTALGAEEWRAVE